MSDDLTDALRNIKQSLPDPRTNLTVEEKKALIKKLGPRTVKNLISAKKDFAIERIPFLFNSLDSQDVVDIIHNEWESGLFPPSKKP